MLVLVQANTINSWILPYKSFVMQKYLTLCPDIPYQADAIDHAMSNKMAKITVAPYLAGMVNHTTMKIICEDY